MKNLIIIIDLETDRKYTINKNHVLYTEETDSEISYIFSETWLKFEKSKIIKREL